MHLPNRVTHYKRGWRRLKYAVLTISGLAIAAGILAGMVLYTVSLMRQCQMKILTGDLSTIGAVAPWEES